MKTDELISMLSNGTTAVDAHALRRRCTIAIGWGALGAALLMAIALGVLQSTTLITVARSGQLIPCDLPLITSDGETIWGMLLMVISLVTFVAQAFAFVDAFTHRAEAYVAADKMTKQAWCIILGLADVNTRPIDIAALLAHLPQNLLPAG